MRRRRLMLAAAGLVLVTCAAPVQAAHWNLISYFCVEEIVRIPELLERVPVPVGCEVVDCCPGCPGPGPIDWRIRVAGELVSGVDLGFDGVDDVQSLVVEGAAKVAEQGVAVGPGEAMVRGLPSALPGRVARASLGLRLDEVALQALRDGPLAAAAGDADKDGGGDADAGLGTIEVAIEQLLGNVVVNEFRAKYILVPCFRPYRPCDAIRLQSNAGNDNSVIQLDGRRSSGCQDDRIYRTQQRVEVGNVLTPGGCNSEVAVYSSDDAMEILTPETSWTDSCGDEVTATLDPMLQAPVNIWLATAGAAGRATADLANANLLYNQNKTGISFVANTTNVTGNAGAVATIGTGCGSAGGLPGSGFYNANQLNVYYVNAGGTAGNCIADRNVVYVYTAANLASLAHEFGHSFSLFGTNATGGHTNIQPGFTNQNIMWGGGPGTRNHFSLGQAFRFNIDGNSSLNVNGVRTGTTRSCPALTTSATCPALALDWARP